MYKCTRREIGIEGLRCSAERSLDAPGVPTVADPRVNAQARPRGRRSLPGRRDWPRADRSFKALMARRQQERLQLPLLPLTCQPRPGPPLPRLLHFLSLQVQARTSLSCISVFGQVFCTCPGLMPHLLLPSPLFHPPYLLCDPKQIAFCLWGLPALPGLTPVMPGAQETSEMPTGDRSSWSGAWGWHSGDPAGNVQMALWVCGWLLQSLRYGPISLPRKPRPR